MPYSIQLAGNFAKNYAKLTRQEQEQVDEKLRLLASDPWHPSLRVKKIRGTREFEASVNRDIRMAFLFAEASIIVMLDVGHHDKLLERRARR